MDLVSEGRAWCLKEEERFDDEDSSEHALRVRSIHGSHPLVR